MSSRDPAGTPAKSLSNVTVCGGFARFLSAHVLAAFGTSHSWFVLLGAILPDSMRSANNPLTNTRLGPEAKPGAAASHQRRARQKLLAYSPQMLRACNGAGNGLKPLRLDTQHRAGGEFGPP